MRVSLTSLAVGVALLAGQALAGEEGKCIVYMI